MEIVEKQSTYKTPDGNIFSFAFLDEKSTKELQSSNSFYTAPEEFQLNNGHKILKDSCTFQIMELHPDNSSYVFFQKDFFLYKEGENYWRTSIFQEGASTFISFNLMPAKAINFIRDAKKHSHYNEYEGYIAYLTATEEVVFARHRINELYDALWYPTIKDFEYSYQSFFY